MGRRNGPTVLVMGRQNLPVLDRETYAAAAGVQRGGYVLWESSNRPEAILIGTGSEVHIALDAGKILEEKGIMTRVVSLPSWKLFDAQSTDYRNSILPSEVRARVSIEAATSMGWERYVGIEGVTLGIPHFGASAPAVSRTYQSRSAMTNTLREVQRLGQSICYDNIRRGLINSGELASLIDLGVGGVTSNSTIFE